MKNSLLTITLLLLFVSLVFANVSERRVRHHDFYKTLNVPRNATEDMIKKAFRKILITQHPDKAETTEDRVKAEKMFPLYNEAYEVLSDSELRRELDALLDGKTFVWYSVTGRPLDGRYGFPILYAVFVVVHWFYKYYRYKVNYNEVQRRLKMKVEFERKRLSRKAKKEEKRLKQQFNQVARQSKRKAAQLNPDDELRKIKEQQEQQLDDLENTKIELTGGVHFPGWRDCLVYKNIVFVPTTVMYFTRLIRYYLLGLRTYDDVVFKFRQQFSLSTDSFQVYEDAPMVQALLKRTLV
ncbi:hypothetical protein GEMRC1_008850 [Eukaryota sp. GEM-RC1]